MKLKLTYSQFTELYNLFSVVVNHYAPKSIEQKLLFALMRSIYKKLYSQNLEVKKKYTVKCTDAESIGFLLFFRECQLPNNAIYEANLINQINSVIYQNLAKP